MPCVSVELKISFDGNVPGLPQHRLSMSSFAEAFRLLSIAFQRTASFVLNDTLDPENAVRRGGRLEKDAKRFDLELKCVEAGSACPVFECIARAPSAKAGAGPEEGEEEAARVVSRFVSDIEKERRGQACNPSVRSYLAALPAEVRKQRYTATKGDQLLADCSFDQPSLPEHTSPGTKLIQIRGNIISVGFPPGPLFIGIKKMDGHTMKCEATLEQANTAVALREQPVAAAVLHTEKPSLLWIRAEADLPEPNIDESFAHILKNWSRTLEILAE